MAIFFVEIEVSIQVFFEMSVDFFDLKTKKILAINKNDRKYGKNYIFYWINTEFHWIFIVLCRKICYNSFE